MPLDAHASCRCRRSCRRRSARVARRERHRRRHGRHDSVTVAAVVPSYTLLMPVAVTVSGRAVMSAVVDVVVVSRCSCPASAPPVMAMPVTLTGFAGADVLVAEAGARVAGRERVAGDAVVGQRDRGRRRPVVDLVDAGRGHRQRPRRDVGRRRGGGVAEHVVARVGAAVMVMPLTLTVLPVPTFLSAKLALV